MDRELFDAVQAKLTEQWSHRTVTRTRSASLAVRVAVRRCRSPHGSDTRDQEPGALSVLRVATSSSGRCRRRLPAPISRVPAAEIEAAVIKALAVHLGDRTKPTADANRMHREIVTANVARIEVRKNQLAVRLKTPNADAAMDRDQAVERRSHGIERRRKRLIASDPLVQATIKEVSRDPVAAICLTAGGPPDQGRATSGTDQVHRAWPRLAGRDRLWQRAGG